MSNTRPVAVSPAWLTCDGDRVVIGLGRAEAAAASGVDAVVIARRALGRIVDVHLLWRQSEEGRPRHEPHSSARQPIDERGELALVRIPAGQRFAQLDEAVGHEFVGLGFIAALAFQFEADVAADLAGDVIEDAACE